MTEPNYERPTEETHEDFQSFHPEYERGFSDGWGAARMEFSESYEQAIAVLKCFPEPPGYVPDGPDYSSLYGYVVQVADWWKRECRPAIVQFDTDLNLAADKEETPLDPARLFSAAPDMLKALCKIIGHEVYDVSGDYEWPMGRTDALAQILKEVEQAIRKATVGAP